MLARGRHPGVDQRRDHHVEEGPPGEASVLGVVVGAFQGEAVGTDRNGAPQVRPGTRQRGEVGQGVERQVHLAGGALEPVAPDRLHELAGQLVFVEHAEEGAAGIHARGDLVGEDLLAALEHHPGRPSAARQDALDPGVRADLGTEATGGARERLGDRAHPPALETPRPRGAVDLAHVVVEQHVGGPRRGDAQEGAHDAARRHGGLEGVGLEPAVEVVGGARRHEPREFVETPVAEAREVRGQVNEAAQLLRADRAHPRGRHREQLPDPPAEVGASGARRAGSCRRPGGRTGGATRASSRGSCQRVSARPSGSGVNVPSSAWSWRPCRARSRSSMICGRSRLTT